MLPIVKRTSRKKSSKDPVSVEKKLYRFIQDDYNHHAILESAVVAIAKQRAKRPFPKEKAVKVIGIVVSDAHRWYNRHVERLPRLRSEVKETIAGHLYDTWENDIKKLTSYYKSVATK